jgi:hypothetical protein
VVAFPAAGRRAGVFRPAHIPHFAARFIERGAECTRAEISTDHIPRFLLRPHGLRGRTACSVNLLRSHVDGDRAEQQILEIETEIR